MSSDKNASYVFEIVSAKLTLNYLRPTDGELSERNKMTMSRPILYPYIASKTVMVNVPPGVGRFSRVIYNGAIPSRIVLGVSSGLAQAGSYKDNPVNFELNKLARVVYDVGNQRLPLVGGLRLGPDGDGSVDMATPFMINQVCVGVKCVVKCVCRSFPCTLQVKHTFVHCRPRRITRMTVFRIRRKTGQLGTCGWLRAWRRYKNAPTVH
jgi:hypothetical protein